MVLTANIVDVFHGVCRYGTCVIEDGRIASLQYLDDARDDVPFLMPGFIDAHVHIESSMLVPTEFARLAVRHGTVATISDPHEIANVLGIEGVRYMLANAAQTPMKIHFGAPSCVPATAFETAGASLGPAEVRALLEDPAIHYLAEMMNYPGVLQEDPVVMEKLAIAREVGKPVDGHAPGVTGDDALRYINAGISTDHECVSYEEALHKLRHGMQILIREGSAARNFEALHPLISEYPDRVMFCSDDKHPDDLLPGHINQLAARAVRKGHHWSHILKAACLNPILHYRMDVGLLRAGDRADCILVNNLEEFKVLATYVDGQAVYAESTVHLPSIPVPIVNQFRAQPVSAESFQVRGKSNNFRVIRAIDGSLLTAEMHCPLESRNGFVTHDPEHDVLKIAVVNRYAKASPALGFIHGFGLRGGALASSVAHDSHNIVAVGVDDISLAKAINLVIAARGGVAAVDGQTIEKILPLPVAGIMSDKSGEEVAARYTEIDAFVKSELGSSLRAPFMTLSFMALLVIPQLKLSDLGLFDGKTFTFADLEV